MHGKEELYFFTQHIIARSNLSFGVSISSSYRLKYQLAPHDSCFPLETLCGVKATWNVTD